MSKQHGYFALFFKDVDEPVDMSVTFRFKSQTLFKTTHKLGIMGMRLTWIILKFFLEA